MGSVASSVGAWFSGIGIASKVIVAGSIVGLVAGIGYGLYKLYQYCTQEKEIYQSKQTALSDEQQKTLDYQTIQKKMPRWKKLKITEQQLQEIQALTKELFQRKVQQYTCPITQLIMREPVQSNCCKKYFEKEAILFEINRSHKCPCCRRENLTHRDIITKLEELDIIYDAIENFRFKIRRTFRSIREISEKKWWQQNIDLHMGYNYVLNDL